MATWGTKENHAGLFEIKQKPQRCNNNRNEKQCKNGHKICHAQRFKKNWRKFVSRYNKIANQP
jgi:hypothetical protein